MCALLAGIVCVPFCGKAQSRSLGNEACAVQHVLVALDPVGAVVRVPLQRGVAGVGGPAKVIASSGVVGMTPLGLIRSVRGVTMALLQSPLSRSENAAVLLRPSLMSPKRAPLGR